MVFIFGVLLNLGCLLRGCEFFGFMFFLILVMIKRFKYIGWNKYGFEFMKFLKILY